MESGRGLTVRCYDLNVKVSEPNKAHALHYQLSNRRTKIGNTARRYCRYPEIIGGGDGKAAQFIMGMRRGRYRQPIAVGGG